MKYMIRLVCCLFLLSLLSYCNKVDNGGISPVASRSTDTFNVADCKQCIVLDDHVISTTDYSDPAVYIVDVSNDQQKIVWKWDPKESTNKDLVAHSFWFNGTTDAKPVYNCKCLLINSTRSDVSGKSVGGIALVRIADKR